MENFVIFRCFRLNIGVLHVSAEGASEKFKIFYRGTAYDAIIFKFEGSIRPSPLSLLTSISATPFWHTRHGRHQEIFQGMIFSQKPIFFSFLHKKEKTANFCKFSALKTKLRTVNASQVWKKCRFYACWGQKMKILSDFLTFKTKFRCNYCERRRRELKI